MSHVAKDKLPKYQQVAIAIAERIASEQYPVGQKLRARSTLANSFRVSAETARKAINVLVDLNIVSVKHGSGVEVASKERAEDFLSQYANVQSLQDLKLDIVSRINQQKAELTELTHLLDELVSQTQQVHTENQFLPYELTLTATAAHLDKSLSDLHLWQETSATIIAIKHEEDMLLSPGPYAMIAENDTLYFVGDEYTKQRLTNFFYPNGIN